MTNRTGHRARATKAMAWGAAWCMASAPAFAQMLPPAQQAQETVARLTAPAGAAAQTDNSDIAQTPPGDDVISGLKSVLNNDSLSADSILHGRFPVQFGVSVGAYYDDNIFLAPDSSGERIPDYVATLAPFVAWNSAGQTGALNSVQIVYTPTFLAYLDHSELDAVNHDGSVIYGFSDGRVDLLVTEQFTSAQENDPDEEGIFRETENVLTGKIDYQVANKITLELVGKDIFTSDNPGYQANELSAAPYFNYAVAPKIVVGLGCVAGIVYLDGPNQTFQQINLRCSYNPDPKLTFDVVAGMEARETQGDHGIPLTPDFSLGGTWAPFDDTEIAGEAYRRYEYSGRFAATSYLATGVLGSVTQRIFRHFKAGLTGSFEDADYDNDWTDATDHTSYDFVTIKPSLDWSPEEDWDFRVFYQFRGCVGRGEIGNFTDNQVGFTASYTY